MKTILLLLASSALANFIFSSVDERTWKDQTGHFEFTAALVGFDGTTAILKKSDGELVAFPIANLSDADREFLQSEESGTIYDNPADQTWTFKNGQKVTAHVVSHIRKEVTLQYRRGKVYVNDRPFDKLPDVYKTILPHVVNHLEKTKLADEREFRRWITKQHGKPVQYNLEGVVLAFEDGEEYAFPYFLFSDQDRKFLELGKGEYQHPDTSEDDRAQQALYMQAMAQEYQRDQQIDRQIKMVQTEMLAVAAGVVDLWEVALVPPGGNIYQARSVVVPARNSLEAQQAAMQRWPGFVLGPTRRVNRNR